MLQPRELKLEEMGDLAEIIPGPEPVLTRPPYIRSRSLARRCAGPSFRCASRLLSRQ